MFRSDDVLGWIRALLTWRVLWPDNKNLMRSTISSRGLKPMFFSFCVPTHEMWLDCIFANIYWSSGATLDGSCSRAL
jgi:hypothetical protein